LGFVGTIAATPLEVAASADPLCRAELARVEGDRLVEHLAAAGPSTAAELKEELGIDTRTLRRLRARLERVGAIVPRDVIGEICAG